MNNRRLRILQLNIRKTRASTEAFINDSDTNKFDILLVQEPSTSKYRPHVQHRQWQLYKPTRSDDNKRERSILYINKRLSSASYRQIDCDSTDVVAISILTPMSKFLIFSVYTPPIDVCTAANGTELQPTLEAINQTIQEASPEIGDRLRVIIAGDFNRHHPSWGHNRINRNRMGDAEELLIFMQNKELQNCVPRGTPTYWSFTFPGSNSTLDLTLSNMPERLLKCHLYGESFGSDHRGIVSEWDLQPELRQERQPRPQLKRTEWTKVGQQIRREFNTPPTITTKGELDAAVNKLIDTTITAVKDHTPMSRPSPVRQEMVQPGFENTTGRTQHVPTNMPYDLCI